MKRGPGRKTASMLRAEQARAALTPIVDLDNHRLCLQLACLLEDFKVHGQLTEHEWARLAQLGEQVAGRIAIAMGTT